MNKLFIFDVDGTLCQSGQIISPEMTLDLQRLKQQGYRLGIIGGGTAEKIRKQLEIIWNDFEFVCCENGHVSYRQDNQIYQSNLRDDWSDEYLSDLVSHLLKFTAELNLPVKTGKFIDLRNGLIYWSPVGQNCTLADRAQFVQLDQTHHYRQQWIQQLKKEPLFQSVHLSLGGQLGIAIAPIGWDKSFPFQHPKLIPLTYRQQFDEIYFFGDKMEPDGSDAPVKQVTDVICVAINNPTHLRQVFQCEI